MYIPYIHIPPICYIHPPLTSHSEKKETGEVKLNIRRRRNEETNEEENADLSPRRCKLQVYIPGLIAFITAQTWLYGYTIVRQGDNKRSPWHYSSGKGMGSTRWALRHARLNVPRSTRAKFVEMASHSGVNIGTTLGWTRIACRGTDALVPCEKWREFPWCYNRQGRMKTLEGE